MDYTLDEVLSMSVSDIDPNFPIEKWNEYYREVKKKGSMRIETQQISGDGQTHFIEVSTNYLKFGDREFMCSFGRDITKRKRAKEALFEQLEFERLIAEIAARKAQVEPEKLKDAVNSTLQALGRFLRTKRAFLAQFSEDGSSLIVSNVWAEGGTRPSSSIFEIDLVAELPWVAQQIRNGVVINFGPDLTRLPDEAEELRKWLEGDGINSGVVVPVRAEGSSVGMLGLDTLDQPRGYPPSIVAHLRIVADMIGSTLHRLRMQKKLQQSQHIVESTTSVVGLVDRKFVYQYVNNAYCAAYKKNRHVIIGGTVSDLFGIEMFDQVLKRHYESCFAGEEVTFQSWFDLPGWGNRFMDVRYSPIFGSSRKVSAVVVSAHDITEVKQLEMKLQESEERFRTFMDNTPAACNS